MKPSQESSRRTASLDAEEFIHLAIQAMRKGRDDNALEFLQRASQRDPGNGNPHHLRGAILASRGEPAKAVEAMTQALTLNPDLVGARLQLGLLHFTSGQVAEAQSVWQAFDDLDERHPLRLFRAGMLHLAKNELAECVSNLELAISLCSVASINNDMQRVIDKVRPLLSTTRTPAVTDPLAQDTAQHVMLSRYGATLDDSKGS